MERSAVAAEPASTERTGRLRRHSVKLIIALIGIVLVAVVVALSFSIFGSSPATPGNMLTSGMTEQSNSNDDAAILTVDDLMPGEYQSGAVTIDNVGDSAGDFTLEASNLVDDPVTPALSRVLTLAVTHGSNVVYNGPLSDFRSLDLGTWPAGESHTFTFTATLAEDATHEYQGATTTLELTWKATESSVSGA